MVDALANFAYGTVATPPSPATSGITLTLQTGEGANFPAEPFDLLFWPAGVNPLNSNAELARCTNVTGDTLTFTRAQYGTTAQPVAVGYQVSQPIDAHLLTQLAGGGVSSVFTRTGAVVATSGDYTVSQITGAAPLASPTFTGTPAAPTATALTDSTQLATTAYADLAVGVETTRAEAAEALKAPLASPALTGTPTAPTKTALTNNTDIATTAYTDTAVGVETTRAEAAEALLANRLVPLSAPVTATAHTLAANEFCPCDTTSNAITVKLPQAPADGSLAAVKLVTLGGSNSVTYQTQGSDVFNKTGGSTSGTLTLASQGIWWQYKASDAIWYVLGDDLPLSQLDARYLELTGGTMSGAIAMGAHKITGLTNGSASTDAAAFGQILTPPSLMPFMLYTGQFMLLPQFALAVTGGGSALTQNTAYAVPFSLATAQTLANIGTIVQTAGGSGSVCRFGIYNDSSGYPGSLVADFGTVATVTGSGTHAVISSLSQLLPAGIYWAVISPQVGTGPITLLYGTVGQALMVSSSFTYPVSHWTLTGVSGALPTPFTAGGTAQHAVAGNGTIVPGIILGA